MRAAIQHEPAATPVMEEMEEPTAADGEVLIHLRTAGLGGWDVVGAYRDAMNYPCVVRGEGVGFTDDGRRVYFGERSRLPYGAFAEQTVVPQREVWEVPDDISDRLAITMAVAGTGAYLPLKQAAKIQPGETVLITGATGAVGQIGLQVARHFGAGHLVAAGRSKESLEELVARGIADTYALMGTEDDVASLKEASGGDGYDVVLDMLYGDYFTSALKVLKYWGRIVTIGAQAGLTVPVFAGDLMWRWHASWGTGDQSPEDRRVAWLELLELGRQGMDVNYKEFTFDESAEAYEAQRAMPHAKIVVSIP